MRRGFTWSATLDMVIVRTLRASLSGGSQNRRLSYPPARPNLCNAGGSRNLSPVRVPPLGSATFLKPAIDEFTTCGGTS